MIIKGCSGIACDWCVSLDIASILTLTGDNCWRFLWMFGERYVGKHLLEPGLGDNVLVGTPVIIVHKVLTTVFIHTRYSMISMNIHEDFGNTFIYGYQYSDYADCSNVTKTLTAKAIRTVYFLK